MISKSSIENLKNTIDIVDTVSSYIQLKKSGSNFKANCPFHDEKTASFVVSPSKQIYHCFGCQVGGDSIKFVMELEKLNYPEALEKLADQNNITLEYEDKNYKKQDFSTIEKLNSHYINKLDHNQTAKKYLEDRGVWHSTIEKFGIGYANSSNDTINFLKQNMLNLNDAVEFGLIGSSDNGLYARFIDRITFPIHTNSGKICGFGGRTITGHQAKYINSPQTKLFNKSRILYAYDKAAKQIYKNKQIIITEGYLDVIMLHQAGFINSVATLGTALTKEHLPLLCRGEPEIILAYDGDKAGKEAAKKASYLLSANNLEGSVVLFDEGVDPADIVKQNKIEELGEIFLDKIPFVRYIIDETILSYDTANPYQKKRCLDEISSYMRTLNKIVAQEYKTYISTKLNIKPQHIKIDSFQRKREDDISFVSKDIAELCIIKTALSNDECFDIVLDGLNSDMFLCHKDEFNMLLTNKTDQSLISISLTDDINILTLQELNFQISMMVTNYYKAQLLKIKQNTNMQFKQKVQKIKELQQKIKELKKS
ncbi:MAG: DNA primase [Epsilonproteobacteria bacterium]|nr:MAG: DNA primase [Campylobacterota bacterium]